MKRIGLHATNWVGYLAANFLFGKLVGMLFNYLFRGFLTDEGYAAEHPKKYLLGVIGIIVLAVGSFWGAVWYPLTLLGDFIDSKIDKFADEKEWD